jgi:hypothetical protein
MKDGFNSKSCGNSSVGGVGGPRDAAAQPLKYMTLISFY